MLPTCRFQNRFVRITSFIVVVFLFIALFFTLIFGDRTFGLRDDAHFYNPLLAYVQSYWQRGELPLWDPCENLGQPLAAIPTSLAWYPLRTIFFVPQTILDYQDAYNRFILIHFILACGCCYILTRRWKFSTVAATMAAVCYTFGGAVLFQYCNIIFLIGAAWLPLAIYFADRLIDATIKCRYRRCGDRRATCRQPIIGLALTLAMMVLGGDPQMAYLTGLAILGLAFVRIVSHRGTKAQGEHRTNIGEHIGSLLRVIVLLLLSAVLAAGISAIQIIPSVELALQSDRHNAGEHAGLIYRYSVTPWDYLGLFYPHFGGKLIPANSRWFASLPNDNLWFYSCYMGLIPVLLALSVLRFRRRTGQVSPNATIRIWATWLVLLSATASLGGMGLFWFIRVFRFALGSGDILEITGTDPVGGLYWLMNQTLPGFSIFRYPAKLSPLVVLGIAVLAGIGLDVARKNNAFRFYARSMLILSAALLIILLATGTAFFDRLPQQAESFYGPFQPQLAWRNLVFSGAGSTIISAVVLLIIRITRTSSRNKFWKRQCFALSLLLILTIDLLAANRSLIVTVPKTLYTKEVLFANIIKYKESQKNTVVPMIPVRYFPLPGLPASFANTGSPHRNAERILWERNTLASKYHYQFALNNLDSPGTVMAKSWRDFLDSEGKQLAAPSLALLDAKYVILPENWSSSFTKEDIDNLPLQRIEPENFSQFDSLRQPIGTSLWQLRDDLFPASNRIALMPVTQNTTDEDAITDISVLQDRIVRPEPSEFAEISKYESNRIEIDLCLNKEYNLILAEQYYPGWRAAVYTNSQGRFSQPGKQLEVKPIIKMFRSIRVPAGEHKLIVQYQPQSFRLGLVITLFSIAVIISWQIFHKFSQLLQNYLFKQKPLG